MFVAFTKIKFVSTMILVLGKILTGIAVFYIVFIREGELVFSMYSDVTGHSNSNPLKEFCHMRKVVDTDLSSGEEVQLQSAVWLSLHYKEGCRPRCPLCRLPSLPLGRLYCAIKYQQALLD